MPQALLGNGLVTSLEAGPGVTKQYSKVGMGIVTEWSLSSSVIMLLLFSFGSQVQWGVRDHHRNANS